MIIISKVLKFIVKTIVFVALFDKKEERCYVNNIFTTNHKWLVVIGSNLNLILRLLFCPNNNNLPLRICCKNIMDISFLKKEMLLGELTRWIV